MFSKLIEAITKDLSEMTTEMTTLEKETSTVHTVESSDDDISECNSLETIDLLQLDDDEEEDDLVSFYYDDDDFGYYNSPQKHKHSCVQKAMNGFTGMLSALTIKTKDAAASSVCPVSVILTEGVEDDFLFR